MVPSPSAEQSRYIIPPQVPVHVTDYSLSSLKSILRENDIDCIICALSAQPESSSKEDTILDAALEAGGVKLFIPSEWALDSADPESRKQLFGFVDSDYKLQCRLTKLEEEGKMRWAGLATGCFFDMALHDGELDVDLEKRTMKIWEDAGYICGSSLPFIGSATVALVRTMDEGEGEEMTGRLLYLAQARFNQEELLAELEKDGRGKYELSYTTIRDERNRGLRALKEGDILGSIQPIMFAAGYEGAGDFVGKGRDLINRQLGLPEPDLGLAMTDARRWRGGSWAD